MVLDAHAVGKQGRIPAQARIQLGDQMVGEGVVRDHRPLLICLRVVLVKDTLLHAEELINTVPVIEPAVAGMREQGRIARLLIVPRQCVDRLMHHAKGGNIRRRDHVCLNTGQNIKLRICRSRAEIAHGNMTAPGTRRIRQHVETVHRIVLLGVGKYVRIRQVTVGLAHQEEDIGLYRRLHIMLRVLIDQRLYLRFLISVRFFDRIQVIIVQKAVWEAAQTEHLRHIAL